ncbi:MAG: rhodanese-like domain-containing protein, partial [Bacteroidota bacterium]
FLFLLMAVFYACNGPQQSDQAEAEDNTHQEVSNTAPAGTPKATLIEPGDLEQLKHVESNLQLIDVRTPEEVAQGAIEGATNINFRASDFQEKILALDKEQPVLVYCKSGGRSGKTADLLVKQGFTKVYDLDGGYTAFVSETED